MEIKVFNSELTYLGVVDNFESIKFVAKYSQCGNFTIKAALTKQTNTYFKVGNIILFDGKSGYIHSIEIDIDTEKSITVNGYDLSVNNGGRATAARDFSPPRTGKVPILAAAEPSL